MDAEVRAHRLRVAWRRHCPQCAAGNPAHVLVWHLGALTAATRGLGTAASRAAEALRGFAAAYDDDPAP